MACALINGYITSVAERLTPECPITVVTVQLDSDPRPGKVTLEPLAVPVKPSSKSPLRRADAVSHDGEVGPRRVHAAALASTQTLARVFRVV